LEHTSCHQLNVFWPYALIGLHSLPGVKIGYWKVTGTYRLTSIEMCLDCKIAW
jgi:hypothetical protein